MKKPTCFRSRPSYQAEAENCCSDCPVQRECFHAASTPWRIDINSVGRHWKDSISILDADGGEVAVLTRGYQNGASLENAFLIVEAVNAR